MSEKIPVRVQHKRMTALQWASSDVILLNGEIGVESDTGYLKVGDGTNLFKNLKYLSGPKGDKGEQGEKGEPGSDADVTNKLDRSGDIIESYGEKVVILNDQRPIVIRPYKGNVFYIKTTGLTEDSSVAIMKDTYDFGEKTCYSITLILDGSEGYGNRHTYPSEIKWANGEPPRFGPGKIGVVVLMTFDGGTTWLGMIGGEF